MKFFALLFLASALRAAVPEGIPRELARSRAQRVSDLHYHLHFDLAAHADSTHGHETLTFNLTDAAPLLIDYRAGTIQSLLLNGDALSTSIDNGHLHLPAVHLKPGLNKLEVDFTSPVAPAGKAITRYEDKDDGSEYIYTLFVPMDASMAFPCFDQPDLKGRFTLELNHPANWQVISNVALGSETEPISTYLFAFAAGPFEKVHSTAGLPDVYVRKSQFARAGEEVPQIQLVTAFGLKYLANYFAQPFPFPKYDMVLIPGFPFGGMEHAGATFLNEDAMLFRTAPTESDRFGRNVTVMHELVHQWFGDFTTMRWFDDLWLKEGFAQYMAYHAMADYVPEVDTWARFYQQINPPAYSIDITLGTTPIYQDIPNLKDAKSAYGAIVYSKAPGVLRQLEFLLGAQKFRDGLRLYLAAHRYANAEWSNLVLAFEQSSGLNLSHWAQAWIKERGVPVINTVWSCSAGTLDSLTLSQHSALDDGRLWPIATEVRLGYSSRPAVLLRAQINQASAKIASAHGQPCPDYIFANNADHAYGMFLLDGKSRAAVIAKMQYEEDLFSRVLLWGALYDSMHFSELSPHDYVDTALSELPSEQDETLLRSVNGHTIVALHQYLASPDLIRTFESLSFQRMLHSKSVDERIVWFRAFVGAASTPQSLGDIKRLLSGDAQVPGVAFRPLDRWRMVTALLSQDDPEALAMLEAEKQRDPGAISQKYAYTSLAARPSASNKNFYFNDYLHDPARPEDWVQDSLASFNEWNQSELTFAYLEPALVALPQIKRERKIFFLMAWLNAFIGGQQTKEASQEVHSWLADSGIDPDLRLKVLQVVDDLDRTVKIREKFTTSSRSGQR